MAPLRVTCMAAALGIAIVCAFPGCADPSANAATVYDETRATIGVSRIEALCDAILDDRTREVSADLAELQPRIERLVEATRLARCSYPDPEVPDTNFPYTSRLRRLGALLYGDGARLSRRGEGLPAAERGAAMVRLATHAAQNEDEVGKLVAVALLGLAKGFVIEHAPDGRAWTTNEAEVMRAEFEKLDARNPFGNSSGQIAEIAAETRADALEALGR